MIMIKNCSWFPSRLTKLTKLIVRFSFWVVLVSCLHCFASWLPELAPDPSEVFEDVLPENYFCGDKENWTPLGKNYTFGCPSGHITKLEGCNCLIVKKLKRKDRPAECLNNKTNRTENHVDGFRFMWKCGGYQLVPPPQVVPCKRPNPYNVLCEECPKDSAITHISSRVPGNLNKSDDDEEFLRQWNITCGNTREKILFDCYWSGYITEYNKPFRIVLDNDVVFRSFAMYYEPYVQAWKFGFTICSLCDAPKITAWSSWTQCCLPQQETTRYRYRECTTRNYKNPSCGCNMTFLREEESCIPVECDPDDDSAGLSTGSTTDETVLSTPSEVPSTLEPTTEEELTSTTSPTSTAPTTIVESEETTEGSLGEIGDDTDDSSATDTKVIIIVSVVLVLSAIIVAILVMCFYKVFIQQIMFPSNDDDIDKLSHRSYRSDGSTSMAGSGYNSRT